jgi:glycosyltransferase involved in cell wall biosynthesis
LKNICLILSGIETALAFEWISERQDKSKFKLHFILLNSKKGGLEEYLILNTIPYKRIKYSTKKDIPIAIASTYKYLKYNKIDLVHCHLLDAGIVGIVASYLARIKSRIYTRHYSSYHHEYHPKGVVYDRIINRLSTKIVAVSETVQKILVEKEGVNAAKIELIHHGFPLEKFSKVDSASINNLKIKYELTEAYPIIGVVARHTRWKGIQYIIPAFEKILARYPKAKLVLANAKGEYHNEVNTLLKEIPPENFVQIDFEKDLFSLFQCFDIFVHTPINNHSEAFGQVYVEAMASGIPSIFTLSGIGNEIIQHKKNALVVEYQNSEQIYLALLELIEDKALCTSISTNAKETVFKDFNLETMLLKLDALYE